MNAHIANSSIPSPGGTKTYIKKKFDTADIMKLVLDCYKRHHGQLSSFSKSLRGKTIEETCFNVWSFIKDNIRYQVDGSNQYVQTPAALWHSRVGDCKSFAVFAASCLHHLGINGLIRFVSYNAADQVPKHVYVVVRTGGRQIIIDPTPYNNKVYWNREYGPQHKYDYSMAELAQIGSTGRGRTIGRKISGLYTVGRIDAGCQPLLNDAGLVVYDPCAGFGGGGSNAVDPVKPTKGVTPTALVPMADMPNVKDGGDTAPVKTTSPYNTTVIKTLNANTEPKKAGFPWWLLLLGGVVAVRASK